MDFSKLNLINLALAMCSVLEWGKSVLLASIHDIHEAERETREQTGATAGTRNQSRKQSEQRSGKHRY